MRERLAVLVLSLWGICSLTLHSAPVALPREVWRDALSYELCQSARFSPAGAAVLMPSAVCILDYATGEVRRLSTCNHLTTARPVAITFAERGNALYVGHADGAIDVIRNDYAARIETLRNILKPEADIAIRALAANGKHLYALQGNRVVEMNRNGAHDVNDQLHLWLNNAPSTPTCLLACDTALFIGTKQGVVIAQLPIAGARDYKQLGDLTFQVLDLLIVERELLALCDNAGTKELYAWRENRWSRVALANAETPLSIAQGSDGRAYCVTNQSLLRYSGGQFADLVCLLPYAAAAASVDAAGNPIVAFCTQGVQRWLAGVWRRVYNETPRFVSVYDVAAIGNAVVLTSGSPHEKKNVPFQLYYWENGQGKNLEVSGAANAGEIIVLNANERHYLVCSAVNGLFEYVADRLVAHYDNTNSILKQRNGRTSVGSGIALDDGSWWLYNESSDKPLVVRDAQGVWHAFPWSDSRPALPPAFAKDRSGALWIGHDAARSLLRIDAHEFLLSGGKRGTERKGEDRDVTIRSVKVAGDDKLWVGYVNDGVVFAPSASSLAGREANFSIYIFADPTISRYSSRPMGNPPIEKLLIDHGNNVWIATARGGLAHMLTEQQAIRRIYNVDNSPVPSRFLHSLALTQSGVLWVATDRGAVRFKADSEAPSEDFSAVKVYPNPVRPQYDGWITIDGLLEATVVKITDTGGSLVRELHSNGGKALWDGRNGHGDLVQSGVYLLFLASRDGKLTAVEKLVIVR